MTETILLTWLLIVFFAAALQIFVMNESLYRTMTAAHADMFRDGFQHNHWEYDGSSGDPCVTNDDGRSYQNTYNTDEHAKVILNFQDYPEIRVQVLGMFRWWGGRQSIDIQSNIPERMIEPEKGCPDIKCKKLKMAAGPAGPTSEGDSRWSRPWEIMGHVRLYCKAVDSVGHAIGGGIDKIQECANSGDVIDCLF